MGAVALVMVAACGERPAMRPAMILPPGCQVVPAPADIPDSITVALLDAIEPGRAPWAGNSSEQMLFRHLYETLITVDCFDVVRPGLAKSWKGGKGGRRWTFELREDARFWDGTPVTAHDVARSWRDALTLDTAIDSAAATGDRVLHVYLKRRHRHVPRLLSASVFAVTRQSTDPNWLLGSGPYRVAAPTRGSHGMPGRTFTAHPAFGRSGPVVRFMETSVKDARDMLEGGIDVMVTSNPAVLEYAAGRPQFVTAPLPWDRTYVLLAVSRVRELRAGRRLGTISAQLSDGLAQDAVRGDARGYRSPSWWDELRNCGELSAGLSQPPLGPRGARTSSGRRGVLYDLNDPVARDLAERIVALAAADPGVSPEAAALTRALPGLAGAARDLTAEGVTAGELAPRLRRGDDFAYVIPITRRPPSPCYEARELLNRAPWLAALETDFPKALAPLVDTRAHVIARIDAAGLMVDAYGNVVIAYGAPQEE
jgi:hypothetical protein